MRNLPIQLILFGLLAALGNLLGGWLLAKLSQTADPASHRARLHASVALGAGFMLAVVLLDLLPTMLSDPTLPVSASLGWVLFGYLVIQFFEHTLAPHFHFGEETHSDAMRQHGVAFTAIFALGLHAFFDGVAIASGVLTNARLGITLFLAVLLHKVPEGFTVASIVVATGRGKQMMWRATLAIALATFAGVLVVYLVRPALAYTLPLSAGVTLFVAASDLIPELNRKGSWRNFILISLGVALFYLIHQLSHTVLE